MEKLEHTGPAKKKRVATVPQREQLASTSEPPLPKGKGTEPSVQSTKWQGGHLMSEKQREQQRKKEEETSIPLQKDRES